MYRELNDLRNYLFKRNHIDAVMEINNMLYKVADVNFTDEEQEMYELAKDSPRDFFSEQLYVQYPKVGNILAKQIIQNQSEKFFDFGLHKIEQYKKLRLMAEKNLAIQDPYRFCDLWWQGENMYDSTMQIAVKNLADEDFVAFVKKFRLHKNKKYKDFGLSAAKDMLKYNPTWFFENGLHLVYKNIGHEEAKEIAKNNFEFFFDNELHETYEDIGLLLAKQMVKKDPNILFSYMSITDYSDMDDPYDNGYDPIERGIGYFVKKYPNEFSNVDYENIIYSGAKLLAETKPDTFFYNDFHKRYDDLGLLAAKNITKLYQINNLNEDVLKKYKHIFYKLIEKLTKNNIDKFFENRLLQNMFPELGRTYAKLLAKNNPFGFFRMLWGKLPKIYPDLKLLAVENLIEEFPSVFFEENLHKDEKYKDFRKPAVEKIIREQPSVFFEKNLHEGEKYKDFRKPAVEKLIEKNPLVFFEKNLHEDEKYKDFRKPAAEKLIEKNPLVFFEKNLHKDEKYKDFKQLAAKKFIEKDPREFFLLKLDEEFSTLQIPLLQRFQEVKDILKKNGFDEKYDEYDNTVIKFYLNGESNEVRISFLNSDLFKVSISNELKLTKYEWFSDDDLSVLKQYISNIKNKYNEYKNKIPMLFEELIESGYVDLPFSGYFLKDEKFFTPKIKQKILNTIPINHGVIEDPVHKILTFYERKLPDHNQKGVWCHVVNGDIDNLSEFLNKFQNIQGEVCFSKSEDLMFHTRKDGFLGVIVEGPAVAVFDEDVYSEVDVLGRRYQTGKKGEGSERIEAWVVPANTKLKHIVTNVPKFIKEGRKYGEKYGLDSFVIVSGERALSKLKEEQLYGKEEKFKEEKYWDKAEELGYDYADDNLNQINSPRTKEMILSNLMYNLTKMGHVKYAMEIDDLLNEILESDSDDVDAIVNAVGLREDGTIDNMNQGFTLPGFFSHYGDLE